MTDAIHTRYLVLRKTPYSETSLVLAGISPDAGQLHFLVRGARKLGRKQFPVADVLRTLTIAYRPGRGELHSWQEAEMTEDFAAVARQPAAYRMAVWLAHFALANIQPALPQPRIFGACETALRRLAAGTEAPAPGPERVELTCLAARVGLAMVFLDEQGLLPDYSGNTALAQQRERLLAMGENRTALPPLPLDGWKRLDAWVIRALHHADCRLPA